LEPLLNIPASRLSGSKTNLEFLWRSFPLIEMELFLSVRCIFLNPGLGSEDLNNLFTETNVAGAHYCFPGRRAADNWPGFFCLFFPPSPSSSSNTIATAQAGHGEEKGQGEVEGKKRRVRGKRIAAASIVAFEPFPLLSAGTLQREQ
jgi:hypothetical protein